MSTPATFLVFALLALPAYPKYVVVNTEPPSVSIISDTLKLEGTVTVEPFPIHALIGKKGGRS